ncbi:MAG: lipoyl synthase [Candidatus Susulua stagnicola]|nr:lipoyl synthase [Candidatus Susulua stagnicola]
MFKSVPKPPWLNKKIVLGSCRKVKSLLRDLSLHSVCEESSCPNISECFSNGVATFMILGDTCTRDCAFCGVNKGKPSLVDFDEPERIKEAVKRLNLNYVVITSPTRDDLDDGGVGVFCQTVEAVKSIGPEIRVEILIPDFKGRVDLIERIAKSRANVISHNIETIASLYIKVRKESEYKRSLKVLKLIKKNNKGTFTKSGLMLGLGEEEDQVIQTLMDIKRVDCDFLTLGQYLPPSLNHYSLKEYVHPDKFNYFESYARKIGFRGVKSAPYVRSSYLAHSFFKDEG